jgi:hypothetical protein
MDPIRFLRALHAAPSQEISPCLVGPTGAGKTARVSAYAEQAGLPVRRILLGSMLPEDVLGLPRVERGRTVWSLPDWAAEARERPVLLFLDELDKARPECHAAALTLLAEHRVRDVVLHQQTRIVCAMQPVEPREWLADETGRALAARLCFLAVGYDWAWTGHATGLDLSGLPRPEISLPVLEPCPRTVTWWVALCRAHPDEHALHEAAARGLWPADYAEDLIRRLREGPALKRDAVLRLLAREPERVRELTVPELVELAPDILHHCPPATWREMLVRVWTVGSEDEASALLRRAYDELASRVDAAGGELDIAAGASEDEVAQAISDACRAIAEEWQARAKGRS